MDTLTYSSSAVAPSAEVPPAKRMSPRLSKDYAVGLALLGIVVFLWTLSNFVTQALFQNGFQKPFLVTYLNTSAFTLYLLPFFWRKLRKESRNGRHPEDDTHRVVGSSYQPLMIDAELEHSDALHPPLEDSATPLTFRETSDLALAFCFLWFIANWTVNASLFYTSVASATILSSMSGLFTLAIGSIFKVEAMTKVKVFAVILSLGGVALVSLSDSSQPLDPKPSPVAGGGAQAALGDILALMSALFYGLYAILLKVRIRVESRIDMQLFFGFVGLYNILICWVLGVILHITGIERFEVPRTAEAFGIIFLNMFITFTSDYLYVVAMLKTTPLVVTVGLSLTMPFAVIGDTILGKTVHGQVILGALLVAVAFFIVGLSNGNTSKQDEIQDTL